MNNMYICDVTYSDGSVALYGPFANNLTCKVGERAIDFVERIKNVPNSCVVEARIRILNKP